MTNRRQFMRFVAGSPLILSAANSVISDPKDALNVLDFEEAARKALPPAHFAYMATGVDDDTTLRANREGYTKLKLRPKRMVDVRTVDTSTELFGTVWETPILLAPCGNQQAFHPQAELAVGRAANTSKTLQVLSTVTNFPIEEVTKAAGRPIWFQLYPTSSWEVTTKLVRRAESAGCPVLVLTVDTVAGRNTETLSRGTRDDTRNCSACHDRKPGGFFARKPMFQGIDMAGLSLNQPAMSWDFVRRLKDLTKMKLVLKGIETGEDARLCVENGVDGIVVSNHGGRAEESGRGTIECLPEVVQAAGDRIPVILDGGIRRGTDIFKALALGARAVGIGRPYLWGLSAFGQAGVERVLAILRAELELIMKQCGVVRITGIGRTFVQY